MMLACADKSKQISPFGTVLSAAGYESATFRVFCIEGEGSELLEIESLEPVESCFNERREVTDNNSCQMILITPNRGSIRMQAN